MQIVNNAGVRDEILSIVNDAYLTAYFEHPNSMELDDFTIELRPRAYKNGRAPRGLCYAGKALIKVWLNNDSLPEDIRFLVCHELGHLYNRHNGTMTRIFKEHQANDFATINCQYRPITNYKWME